MADTHYTNDFGNLACGRKSPHTTQKWIDVSCDNCQSHRIARINRRGELLDKAINLHGLHTKGCTDCRNYELLTHSELDNQSFNSYLEQWQTHILEK